MAQIVALLALEVLFLTHLSLTNCTWLIFGKMFGGIYAADVPLLPYFHLLVPTRDRDAVLHNSPLPRSTVGKSLHVISVSLSK